MTEWMMGINDQRNILPWKASFSCYQSLKGLTHTGLGIINCFSLRGIFTEDVSSISNKYDQCIL